MVHGTIRMVLEWCLLAAVMAVTHPASVLQHLRLSMGLTHQVPQALED
jgi:hypothetical protein